MTGPVLGPVGERCYACNGEGRFKSGGLIGMVQTCRCCLASGKHRGACPTREWHDRLRAERERG